MPLPNNVYLFVSFAVGITQIIDACVLLRRKGRANRAVVLVSMGELAWALVSWFTWYHAENQVPFWLPASFVAYFGAMGLAGVWVGSRDPSEPLSIPREFVIVGGTFGVYFAVASAGYLAAIWWS
jgi:hypothetical protein